jgi:hypothetical protein
MMVVFAAVEANAEGAKATTAANNVPAARRLLVFNSTRFRFIVVSPFWDWMFSGQLDAERDLAGRDPRHHQFVENMLGSLLVNMIKYGG